MCVGMRWFVKFNFHYLILYLHYYKINNKCTCPWNLKDFSINILNMEPEKSLLKEFLQGGWVVPLIGAGAMLARLLAGANNYTWWQQLKKILTAGISAGIAWFILEQTDISSLYKAVTYGIIGVISPEVIAGIVKIGKRFAANPEKLMRK